MVSEKKYPFIRARLVRKKHPLISAQLVHANDVYLFASFFLFFFLSFLCVCVCVCVCVRVCVLGGQAFYLIIYNTHLLVQIAKDVSVCP